MHGYLKWALAIRKKCQFIFLMGNFSVRFSVLLHNCFHAQCHLLKRVFNDVFMS